MVMSGFLGAGKTTTMIALAEHMDENYGKTAIIAFAQPLGYKPVGGILIEQFGEGVKVCAGIFPAVLIFCAP